MENLQKVEVAVVGVELVVPVVVCGLPLTHGEPEAKHECMVSEVEMTEMTPREEAVVASFANQSVYGIGLWILETRHRIWAEWEIPSAEKARCWSGDGEVQVVVVLWSNQPVLKRVNETETRRT